jgi:hypothetical protein
MKMRAPNVDAVCRQLVRESLGNSADDGVSATMVCDSDSCFHVCHVILIG